MNNSQRELLSDIERYFNCTLTDAEEARLRRRVARTGLHHPLVDEARALMGISLRHRVPAYRWVLAVSSVAAAVALAVGVSAFLHSPGSSAVSGECVAYVDGRQITDQEAVLRLTLDSLDAMERAVEETDDEIDCELLELSPAVEESETISGQF